MAVLPVHQSSSLGATRSKGTSTRLAALAALPTRWMIFVNTSSDGGCSTVSGHLENSGSLLHVYTPSLSVSTVACFSRSATLKFEGTDWVESTETIV